MTTFTKEISFINPAFFDADAKPPKHIEKEVKKIATFKELSRIDKDQRSFQFKLVSIWKSKGNNDFTIDHEMLCEITENAIEVLLIVDPKGFTEVDKTQFLNDNVALINFGMWLMKEKFTPFFQKLMPS